MRLTRRYIQYNDLVIDNYDMLGATSLNVDFKTEYLDIIARDGAHVSFMSKYAFANPQSLSLSISIDMRKLHCDEYSLYIEYVKTNLLRHGKLWAVQGTDLIYAYASIDGYGEDYDSDTNIYTIDVNFILYEGTWRFADKLKVFLKPYIPCNFNDCLEYRPDDGCNGYCDECGVYEGSGVCTKCMCECEFLTYENSYCALEKKAIDAFYSNCDDMYKIMYNCVAAINVFGYEKLWGTKICSTDENPSIVSELVYSRTVKETDNVTIRFVGRMVNPVIEFNGRIIKIQGTYDGILTITPSMDVYWQKGEECEKYYLTPDKIEVREGTDYGFLASHGNNSLYVQNGDCSRTYCAYVKIDAITI